MNSWYRESISSDIKKATEPQIEAPRMIVTGLRQLKTNEIEFLVGLVDNGFKEFILLSDSNELNDRAFNYFSMKYNKDQILSVIKSLEKKNFLKKKKLEPEILCPNCLSNTVKINYSCPECSSIYLSKSEIIEHTYCGYTDDKSSFTNGMKLICPKCKSDLKSLCTNIDEKDKELNSEFYHIKDVLFKCDECGKEVTQPNIRYQCIDCKTLFNYVDATYHLPLKYFIPESIFNKILSRNKVNLLIVEDFAPQADVVAMLLSHSAKHVEYNIAIAGNGTSAILALEENEFDIVLLDLGLPDINGLDLLRDIKTKWPKIQVIVLTGYDDIEIAVEAMKNGASEYLIKKDDTIQNLPNMMKKIVEEITND